ncbi:FxsB family cyclophane-forming radical SAM/SPASM peptide maturase [Actinocorallia longicatena]|uniref:FxsB family radical SAM/SPASM domain protein n=1 Tax=Actinocorallia longicatena TaxID=111803 RepID=A0ABP6QEX2_9ACTN
MDDGGEWPRTLDVQALLESGWRPTPFQEFVFKIHSRCNLACDYCYMYEMADQSWRTQPRRMSRHVVEAVVRRIGEHARGNGLEQIGVTLHGGEPLLAGADHLRFTVETMRAEAGNDFGVDFQVQTNGVLLDAVYLDLFDELGVAVGVSLDGDEAAHQRHRKKKDGSGSYREVRAGLDRLTSPGYRHLFGGLLSTIELRNDPVTTYESLLAFAPPQIDFMLPHGTWDSPPPDRPPDASTRYGDWLIKVFDRWYGSPVRETRIRLFNEIMQLLFGRPSRSEAVGLSPVAVVVVETNGRIEQVDSLKSAFQGATATPFHVARDAFDAVLMLPEMAARQIGARALSPTCQGCDLRRTCGGGLYPHRYRSGTGFLNPSVFCEDLYRLIGHIRSTVSMDLDLAVVRKGRR